MILEKVISFTELHSHLFHSFLKSQFPISFILIVAWSYMRTGLKKQELANYFNLPDDPSQVWNMAFLRNGNFSSLFY